jgi:hypothetical protein
MLKRKEKVKEVYGKFPPTHPPLHCNEEEIEEFGLRKEEIQALKKVLKSQLVLSPSADLIVVLCLF